MDAAASVTAATDPHALRTLQPATERGDHDHR